MAETPQTKTEEQEEHGSGRLGDFVRITIMLWAMGIITANYLGYFKGSIDVTFSASLLSSTAASYGLTMNRMGKEKERKRALSLITASQRRHQMTRAFLVLGITLLAAPAHADLRHVMTQSAQISVDQAYSQAKRIGSTYSASGTNIAPSVTDGGVTTSGAIGGLDMSTITSGVPDIVDTNYDVTTAGSAFIQ